ncbi:MAG: hypothetical protein F9K46_09690 [Anaerolineae bacterium]|nr:MAG: hypothetical protein F9K46_09690 [Anaerolineae bacterium]
MEIVGVVVLVVILLVGLLAYRQRKIKRAAEVADIVRRANNLQQMAETRRFYTPESPDPKPDLEYCNVSHKRGEEIYQVDLFDSDGLQLSRSGLSKSEVKALLEDGNWELIAQELSQKVGETGTIIYQHMRRKSN